MNQNEKKGCQTLKGYTVYLTKQASKLLGTSTIEVEGDTYPKFDSTREMWLISISRPKSESKVSMTSESINISVGKAEDVRKSFELSKESVLMIEYHHYEELKTYITSPNAVKSTITDGWVKQNCVGSSIKTPTAMYVSHENK